ncbi:MULTISPECIES: (E)-4-hydroxy-3-methylbut-2-enyl-diphosphate synthase [unclassified Sphingobacterium]|uniref:(E)-4-hydroxy-3-methylbut-2-enyl-diphosphate synthase n=1 Tax=unclassified Sphingobacterium TaxID=2609468 RepID=UPI0010D96F52|nr:MULTISPECIES: (E)-4-hydroxy-3-methylbut-2-enyl-diphosphate synthase [unclassified Sphingobacterium]MCS3554756.1 (E)-4-hydroxy-3-methylbut-2-enyl-diphosphate synthase [Sphingobacterium sp. JUb21]TCR05847.1 4-hydroxy-3-methylbut-2-en-1-yl diphosphate synthase [Sphingobacterium sp. JUb20]
MDTSKLLTLPGIYCNSQTTYSRWKTREVQIGDVPMGGDNPIRIQSMTTIDTMDTMGSVEQTIRMVDAGCEYVRITAPSIKEANNLANIKQELRARGYHVPLVADIHFTPNAAEVAARIVEKVRVNPGNYADKKKFDQLSYTDSEYQAELDRIYKKFKPLVNICKEYGTAMRIGTNHGSLSDRIMSHYGDTPEGMVESAMEFIRICEDLNYYNLCISMKSSNPQVMVRAYRLLVEKMISENMNYPLHLGVTEAGDGEDGRVKSAVGIGTLLEDGLGDTVRVSLTEEPEKEAPVAIALVNRYTKRQHDFNTSVIPPILKLTDNNSPTPYISKEVNTFIGGSLVPRVVVDISRQNLKDATFLSQAGYRYDMLLDKYHMGEQSVDFVYLGDQLPSFNMPANLKQLYNYKTWKSIQNKANIHPLYTLEEFNQANEKDTSLNIIKIKNEDLVTSLFETLPLDKTIVFLLETTAVHGMAEQRQFFKNLQEIGLDNPVIIKRTYEAAAFSGPLGDFMNPEEPISKLQLYAATDLGALLIDGFGSGVWIDSPATPLDKIVSLSFGILQATRSRISKTEYISCPSCGRTLFDLQETTQMIRNRTNHLKGLKIGIMGCIVNGPGEMADADYGYVGAGPDKITLYRGQEVVKKNVSSAHALDELINIIKSDGLWIEESEIPN